MAEKPATTPAQDWATARAHYDACARRYDEAHANLIEAEEDRETAEEGLLAVAAPSLQEVAIKLRTMWADNLTISSDPYVALQRQLIADVERLHSERK